MTEEFGEVQREFPHYQIWQEVSQVRQPRYAARARDLTVNPHTVVTADLAELRTELAVSPPPLATASRFDARVAHPARIYAHWLGGKDYWPADQKAAEEVMRHRPQVVAGARANRNFLARVVRFLAAECGIRQFLDIGAGLPAPDNTHDVAQAVAPECRIVFVDNDPLVLTHARALLTSAPEGVCGYVDADLRDTATVLREAGTVLDFTQPVGVLLLAVLHFVPSADDPGAIVAALAGGLAPGSFVAVSHLTGDFAPEQVAAAVTSYNAQASAAVTPRTHAEVSGLLGRLPLVAPGVVPVTQWRPSVAGLPHRLTADLYAGVASIPQRHR
jgi:hypothetical protein